MLKSIALEVIGEQKLSCARCEQRVQRLLAALPGVRQVSARVSGQRIDVLCEVPLANAETIAKKLAADGYQTRVFESDMAGPAAEKPDTLRQAAANAPCNRSGWMGGAMSVLASAVGLICPACLPAVAGLLASLGVGVAAAEAFMRPALIVLLMLAVATFAWSAARHKQWWVVVTGLVGSVLVYLGRYYFGFPELWMNQAALWGGASVLVGTSVLNFWLKHGCARCAGAQTNPATAGDNGGRVPSHEP